MDAVYQWLLYLGQFVYHSFTTPKSIADLHGYAARAIKYFVDGLFILWTQLNVWTDRFASWLLALLDKLWTDTIKPGLLLVEQGLVDVAAALGAVFDTILAGLFSLTSYVTVGVFGALALVAVALDALRGALLGARAAVMSWVWELEGALFHAGQAAFGAFELHRGKVNVMALWLNYAFTAAGVVRPGVLLGALLNAGEGAANVITASGFDDALVAAWSKLSQLYSSLTFDAAVDRIPAWVEGGAPVVDKAIAELRALLGET